MNITKERFRDWLITSFIGWGIVMVGCVIISYPLTMDTIITSLTGALLGGGIYQFFVKK